MALVDPVGLRLHFQGISCLGQDLKTSASDVFCRVLIGIGMVAAFSTIKHGS